VKIIHSILVVLALSASATVARAQTPAPSQGTPTDVYHVMFVKATPGQAAALAKELQQQDPKDPMAAHFILLRHQEGADWDYCMIQHLGTKASVEITPPPPNTGTPTRAWHDDTFVAGPAWSEFQRLMGLTGDQSGNPVYVVGVQRSVPGHREQLLQALNRPAANSKVAVTNVTLTHLEGGPWQFLTISRYNSWQDFGADRTANAAGAEGWLEIRQHSAYHTDTIADRVR
jgi:hypothetical protein